MEFPDAIRTAIVSPIALPNPAIIDANIPSKELGSVIPKIVSRLDAPSAYDASSCSLGTMEIASSERVVMVGIDIMASIMLAFKPFNPIGRLNNFFINGAKKRRAKTPYITEGIFARSSIVGFRILLNFGEANFDKYIAVPSDKGIAKSIEKKAIKNVEMIEGKKPKSGGVDVGLHSLQVISSIIEYFERSGIPSIEITTMIPATIRIAM